MREVRKTVDMTLKDFALHTGIPLQTLKNYERGTSMLGAKAASALAGVGVNTEWLLTGTGPMWQADLMRGVDDREVFLSVLRGGGVLFNKLRGIVDLVGLDEFARLTHIPAEKWHPILAGEANPPIDYLLAASAVAGTSLDYLVGASTEEESVFLARYRTATPEDRALLSSLLDRLLKAP